MSVELLRRWLAAYGGPAELLADLHAYGGLAMVSVGAWLCASLDPLGAGLVVAGAGLIWLERTRR